MTDLIVRQKTAPQYDKTFLSNVAHSMIAHSSLLGSLIAPETEIMDFDERVREQVEIFERESSALLRLQPNEYRTKRYELRRLFIIKTLLFVGVTANGNGFAVISALIDTLSNRPELDLDNVIDSFAVAHGVASNTIGNIIDKCINIYNADLSDRVKKLTGTDPLTTKDVLCDLALYIRHEYLSSIGMYNE